MDKWGDGKVSTNKSERGPSVLGAPKVVDSQIEDKKVYKGIGGGMGPADYPHHAKKVTGGWRKIVGK